MHRLERLVCAAWLVFGLCLQTGCIGSYMSPVAQAPLFTKAGEAELGVGLRALAPRRGLVAMARAAVTDHIRVGALASGAVMSHSRDWGAFDGPNYAQRYLGIYGEGFVGAEGAHRIFRYGGMAGAGYGESRRDYKVCLMRAPDDGDDGFGKTACVKPAQRSVDARYVRSYAQLHFGLAPRGPFRLALGIRLPFVHDFVGQKNLIGTVEGFVAPSLSLTRARIELQVLAAPNQRVTLNLSVLMRLGPGAAERLHNP